MNVFHKIFFRTTFEKNEGYNKGGSKCIVTVQWSIMEIKHLCMSEQISCWKAIVEAKTKLEDRLGVGGHEVLYT